jgi:hypothetical protein
MTKVRKNENTGSTKEGQNLVNITLTFYKLEDLKQTIAMGFKGRIYFGLESVGRISSYRETTINQTRNYVRVSAMKIRLSRYLYRLILMVQKDLMNEDKNSVGIDRTDKKT